MEHEPPYWAHDSHRAWRDRPGKYFGSAWRAHSRSSSPRPRDERAPAGAEPSRTGPGTLTLHGKLPPTQQIVLPRPRSALCWRTALGAQLSRTGHFSPLSLLVAAHHHFLGRD